MKISTCGVDYEIEPNADEYKLIWRALPSHGDEMDESIRDSTMVRKQHVPPKDNPILTMEELIRLRKHLEALAHSGTSQDSQKALNGMVCVIHRNLPH